MTRMSIGDLVTHREEVRRTLERSYGLYNRFAKLLPLMKKAATSSEVRECESRMQDLETGIEAMESMLATLEGHLTLPVA